MKIGYLKGVREGIIPIKQMPDATLNQAAPVQNTWYTILTETKNVVVNCVAVGIITTAEDLEARMTIDGVVFTAAQAAAVAGTSYIIYFSQDYTGKYLVFASIVNGMIFHTYSPMPCRTIKVEVRKTTAGGVGNLRGAVSYGVY